MEVDNVIISSGKYDVIETGNAILFDENSDIVVNIKAAFNFEFNIVFSFEENGGERSIAKDVDSKGNFIRIRCTNFGVGAGTVEAIELAHVKSKSIYLHFWVEKIAANNYIRSFQYTVYKER